MKIKDYGAVGLAFMLGVAATHAAAQTIDPNQTMEAASSCVTQARDAAGAWRRLCHRLEGSPEQCAEGARNFYGDVFSQCMTSLFRTFEPEVPQ
jgi:hypothetical protein